MRTQPQNTDPEFAELRQMRLNHGLSLSQVTARITAILDYRIWPSSLSEWERGLHAPWRDTETGRLRIEAWRKAVHDMAREVRANATTP